ncbi:MAG: 50S ribosomal protein L17 [bacterium]|jgi:large subunit ribosomal protein L17
MRHSNSVRKFGRTRNGRNALLKGLVLSFIEHGKITTTLAKAKELRPTVEKMITRAREDNLANRRIILAGLYNNEMAVNKLFGEIAPEYKKRTGGYTRITKLPQRVSDGSPMAVIELV